MVRKVCVVVTARPSYSRIKTALREIDNHPELELQLVLAASTLLNTYGEVSKVIEADGFKVSYRAHTIVSGQNLNSMAKTCGLGTIEMTSAFENLKPDCVVTVADRYETMSTALAAAYMNIPLVHIQGGEVTGSIDEKVRHAITKLADIHLVSNELARQRVIKMGEHENRVFDLGCPSIDIAHSILGNTDLDFDPIQKYGGVGAKLDLSNGYLVVMQHPVTTEYESAREQVTETLLAVEKTNLPVLWFWPNVDAGSDGTSNGIRSFREKQNASNFHFIKNAHPEDFLKLLYNSKGLVGNSSVAIRECSFLGVPAVNIGSRQEGRQRGKNVIDVKSNVDAIYDGISKMLSMNEREGEFVYGDGQSGKRIADLLAKVELTFEKKLAY
ncbi:MAG: UDP-N-acetylglucosamine 2-epimerase (hydrolyzing) [Oligoflexia bacterium]|nr:UDP-N-acetylglucosamine 2-epimerase (hydrolyzing) [Oligoflexia bacterium]